ncbi:phenylacetate--CoA ligase family protein [Vallitalea guaymasensis]|uniref:phenylacetate--CoA ligase family protein n=1 Tax=Vallitalea guaymasensis TaxID=1185412 RepID=UPI00272C5546|nr:hypothetical protein [Vallitalea guaymasensis]
MRVYPLDYIIDYAKSNSPFYKNLYRDFSNNMDLTDLPIVDQNTFWKAMEDDKQNILTGKQIEGRVFKSGGTTGHPKYSPYTTSEWETMCEGSAFYLADSSIRHGDIIANTFYAGNLYASYDYVTMMHYFCPQEFLLLNIGGHNPVNDIVDSIVSANANVLAGLPSVILKIVDYVYDNKIDGFKIETICFAGESLQKEQRSLICKKLHKDIEFRSFGLAGNDYGIVGYFSDDCGINEHRISDKFCIFELIDPDTNEVITEENRPGKICITSLYRLLMPLIRYPIGDMGMYSEPAGKPNRKFKLIGRNEEVARISFVSIHIEEIKQILKKLNLGDSNFQVLLTKEDGLDRLTIKIASNANITEQVVNELLCQCPFLTDTLNKKMIQPVRIIWCTNNELDYNKRTGKLRKLIDLRFN